MSIIVTFILLFGMLAIGYQFYRSYEIKKDKVVFETHWQSFFKADLLNDIEGILFYGDKLVWNRHIEMEHLNKMMKVINSKANQYPELKKLANKILNKNRHLDRPIPGPGNTGAKKQNWWN